MDLKHHSKTNKERVASLRLADGSHQSNENSSTSLQGNEASLNSSSSSRQRTSKKAIAKLEGSVPQSTKGGKEKEIGPLSIQRTGALDDCMPSRQDRSPYLLTKGPTPHEESQYTTRDEAASGAIAAIPNADVGENSLAYSERVELPIQTSSDPLVSAVKVADGDDADAVRIAKEEANALRQQVQDLQHERDNIPVATAKTDGEERQKGKCGLITCVVIVFAIGAGIIVWLVLGLSPQDPAVPTVQPTTSIVPTLAPTPAPTLFPCLEEIFIDTLPNIGNGTNATNLQLEINETNATYFQLCQGDCDVDDDCDGDLICFQRSWAFAPVPGCSCWETDDSRNDYCIEPLTESCLEESNDYPLGLCEGNCEDDFDCQSGFECYTTWSEEYAFCEGLTVQAPGCQWCPSDNTYDCDTWQSRVNSTEAGYCVKMPDKVAMPVASPTNSPIVETTSGVSTIIMQYPLLLLALWIPIFVFW